MRSVDQSVGIPSVLGILVAELSSKTQPSRLVIRDGDQDGREAILVLRVDPLLYVLNGVEVCLQRRSATLLFKNDRTHEHVRDVTDWVVIVACHVYPRPFDHEAAKR